MKVCFIFVLFVYVEVVFGQLLNFEYLVDVVVLCYFCEYCELGYVDWVFVVEIVFVVLCWGCSFEVCCVGQLLDCWWLFVVLMVICGWSQCELVLVFKLSEEEWLVVVKGMLESDFVLFVCCDLLEWLYVVLEV